MKFKSIFPTLLLVFVFFSCGKDVTEVNPDYVGSWDNIDASAYITLTINEDASASYNEQSGITYKTFTGNAKIKGDEAKLKIGFKGFKIDQPPTQVEVEYYGTNVLVWQMVLDGETYEKF